MSTPVTILITSPASQLLAEIAQRRPAWQVMTLGSQPPEGPVSGPLWGFIDWLCPAMSGLEMCRRLRESDLARRAHLTMVLDDADPATDTRRRALQAGADDYIVGPLDAARVIDRIDHIRADSRPARQRLTNGPIAIDLAAHQVRVNGTIVALRPNEFQLLAHFLENPDQVFSRAALIDRLGKANDEMDERTVDVWVGRLRRALSAQGAPDPLRTVRSLGYVLDSL
ncbi:MAG: winged helix-turn-helix domain-containing protein [Proteobacteria bacterium]|nr:winged helix-turn-helix domain-containing protein [Pseudomonadota bacterium]